MNTLMQIAERLGGDVSGDQVLAPGPGHSAADRSLSIKLSPDSPDGFIVFSHSGDDWKVCLAHVRERLGLPKPEKLKKGNGKDGGAGKFIREHIYRTADGAPHLRKRKVLDPQGDRQFPQSHWAGGQWVKDVPKGWPKVLYRLPELLAAPPTSTVYLPEGEKDADTLAALGFVATTAGGVSTKWTREPTEPLKGRRVVVLVDADKPGHAYGEKVARALNPIAEVVKVVDLYPIVTTGRTSAHSPRPIVRASSLSRR